METNVQVDKKGKRGRKFETEVQTVEVYAVGEAVDKKGKRGRKFETEAQTVEVYAVGEAVEPMEKAGDKKGKGAPRPRKWNYGITNEATIIRVAEVPRVAKEIEMAWNNTAGTPTVEEYFLAYGPMDRVNARHGLRVMLRRGLVKIVHPDGSEFPREYVAPEPKAVEEEVVEEEVVEEEVVEEEVVEEEVEEDTQS